MGDIATVSNAELLKKRRKGVLKSKTGCLTCRIRHVKCDESRPSCNRCTDTGRACDFVSPDQSLSVATSRKPRKSENLVILPKRNCHLLPKPVHSPNSQLSINEVDHLEYFHLLCANSFSGHFGTSLWNRTLFQISNSEVSIRNAVVSFATLVRTQACGPCDVDKQEPKAKYVKALLALNRRLDGSSFSRELALICSLLFAAFEAFGGSDTAALQHLWAGFAMLKEHSTNAAKPSDNLREMKNAFTSFDIQASTFASFYEPNSWPIPQIPPSFTDIREAKENLDSIKAYGHQLFKSKSERQRTLPYEALPAEISRRVAQVTSLYSEWFTTFNNFLSEASSPPSSVAIQILQIQYLTIRIFISTYFYRDQLAFDAFTTDFTKTITLASSVLETLMATSSGSVPSFSFEVGIIPALYFAACRCRNPVLRRRAIDLLEKSGVEGLWDGRAMAAAARWVVRLEEEEGDLQDDKGFIPESRRLRDVSVGVHRQAKRMILVSSRRNADGSLNFFSGNVGWGESANVEFEDEGSLIPWIKEWKELIEG